MKPGEEQERTEGREVVAVPTVVMERLGWQTASRDDKAVAAALHTGQEIDAMYELSEAGLLDEFFVFLEELGMMEVIEKLKLPNVQRVSCPNGAVCLVIYDESALWSRVHECIAKAVVQSYRADEAGRL